MKSLDMPTPDALLSPQLIEHPLPIVRTDWAAWPGASGMFINRPQAATPTPFFEATSARQYDIRPRSEQIGAASVIRLTSPHAIRSVDR